MATKITFTDDVGRISAAANEDSSIKWYCYERPFGTGTSIFVQREVNNVLEAEVRFLAEGERPEIFFDPVTDEWIFTYVLNENLWMITIGETDAPSTQASQTGTIIDHYRMGLRTTESRTTQTIAAQKRIGTLSVDVDDSPPRVQGVGVGSTGVPADFGVTHLIRWQPSLNVTTNKNLNVAGFNIYVRSFEDESALFRANSTLIPFVGFDIYEAPVPAVAGEYFVTQVNFKGDHANDLFEARVRPPSDTVFSDGTELPTVNTSRLEVSFGRGLPTEDLVFTFVETLPAQVQGADTYQQTGFGDPGLNTGSFPSVDFEFGIVQVQSGTSQPVEDTYQQTGFGEGLRNFLSGSDFGIVIIG